MVRKIYSILKEMISRGYFLLGMAFGVVALFVFLVSRPDGKLHVVFCSVGQGDAAYIRTPLGADMVIDGGPDDAVLSCLGRHMPFWDRSIDVVMMTHPQKDHMHGLVAVVQRYSVGSVIAGMEGAALPEYREFLKGIGKRRIPVKQLYAGDVFTIGGVQARVIWPSRMWLDELLAQGDLIRPTTADASLGIGSAVLGYQTRRNLNDFSYYLHLTYGTFDTLFTGDGDQQIQPEILADGGMQPVEVLKFPHHGSRTGILPEVLDVLQPAVSVISVGKKNTYGHPAPEALNLLSDKHIQVERTDLKGDVEIISDGRKWWIQKK